MNTIGNIAKCKKVVYNNRKGKMQKLDSISDFETMRTALRESISR